MREVHFYAALIYAPFHYQLTSYKYYNIVLAASTKSEIFLIALFAKVLKSNYFLSISVGHLHFCSVSLAAELRGMTPVFIQCQK